MRPRRLTVTEGLQRRKTVDITRFAVIMHRWKARLLLAADYVGERYVDAPRNY